MLTFMDLRYLSLLLRPRERFAKYCDEYARVCVCVSVCQSARISPEPHARSVPHFGARCLAVTRSSSCVVENLRYVKYFGFQ